MLTRNHRQEALSRAYIQAVAGACGLSCSTRDFDYGFDLTLHEIRERGNRRSETGFAVDVQAKSTTAARLDPEKLEYDLPVPNYEDLRDPTVGSYRILVVLVLPEEESDWMAQTEDQMLLRHAAYWQYLYGWPPTRNRKTVRVEIPRANLFTPSVLQSIMARIVQGESL